MKRYFKKKAKTSNKSFNKSVDLEIARLEAERKPRVMRNGKVIDKSEEITQEIKQLQSIKQTKRTTLALKQNNKLNLSYFTTPCVYRLWDNETLVYVGQTTNLASRIGSHSSDKVFTHFDIYSHIENEAVRLNVERNLIESNRPKYNIVHNSANRS